ncbi:hypothetical protein TWF730_001786 [Orbilia blumenaviensis]|uniref:LOV domain-containing protein n=1 Tax=Orbilia blumenaviensis TaxID=1796055 RepID=A0AAV9UF64_9PEZI
MYATHHDLDDTSAASISDIKLLDALAADLKPSFIVQSRPRPPCRPWPVSWHNDATRTRLRLGRTHSNSNAHSPTSGATSSLNDDGDTSPQDADGSVVHVTTTSLASYDNDFYIWITDRLTYPGAHRHVPGGAYYTCTKGILWTTTLLEVGNIQYLQFTGVPLSWKLSTGLEQGKAERSMKFRTPKWRRKSSFKPRGSVFEARSRPNVGERWAIPSHPDEILGKSELERKLSKVARSNASGSLDFSDADPVNFKNAHPKSTASHPPSINLAALKIDATEPLAAPAEALKQTHGPGIADWTRAESSDSLPEFLKIIRDFDWANTSLGPIDEWPQCLRTSIVLMCSSCFPSALYYGPDYIFIYNEAFSQMMSSLHPWSLGKPCWEVWGGVFDDLLVERFTGVMQGRPQYQEDHEIFLVRESSVEQAYISWALSPIVDEKGECVGIFSISADLTARVLAARSFQMFGEIGTRTSGITASKEFWQNFLGGMQTNETDAPFALVYSRVDEHNDGSSCSDSHGRGSSHEFTLEYEGSYNIPEGHICMPYIINLSESDEGFAAAFRTACGHEFLYLKDSELVPPHLLEGLKSTFDDPVNSVAICPIYSHSLADEISGFLVLGLNTRRPFDDDYKLFVQLLIRQLSSSLSASFFFETEVRRSENLARIAAMEKIILSNQLAAKTMEARASEFRFKRFTEVAPVGIYMCDQLGRVTFVNDAWFEITQVPRDFDVENWIQYVHPDDRHILIDGLAEITEANEPIAQTFRWITPYTTKDGQITERWTLGLTQPEFAEDGSLLGYLGVSTNISEQKLREKTQKKRLEEARELKRQQDNFVDIASHEMRNPLSAILQLSDQIISSLSDCQKYYQDKECDPHVEEEIAAAIDAAQTILLCASHQKRVVDDILTLSKLDSARLVITPVDVQPVAVVNEAIKMFEQECHLNDIHMDLEVDEGYRKLAIDWVKLDPTRLLQVLINLLTNALKFIRSETEKKIIITLSASLDKPLDPEGLMVFPSIRKSDEATESPQQDSSEDVEAIKDSLFLSFEVKDTGKGLTDEEKSMLFQKFSQASPRTHIQYGGSGLGLFISRELVQLQSGEIGVLSEAGKGCAFCFYVKVTRGEPQGTELPVYARTIVPGNPAKRNPGGLPPPLNDTTRAIIPGTDTGITTPVDSRTPDSRRLEGYKVLVVEDNLVNQNVIRKQLQKLGCQTHVANHGLEALEKVMQSNLYMKATGDAYDLTVILMDVEMPVMDGLKATGEIRKLEAEGSLVRRIPIIAVTANARPEQIKQMKEAGMDDVLSKPFRIPELVKKLEGVLGKEEGGGPKNLEQI